MLKQPEHRDPVEQLAEEFLHRRRGGEAVAIRDYVRDYPDWKEQIQTLFPMMLALEELKTSRITSVGDPIDLYIPHRKRLGDFRLIREIGRGGMGVVFEAEQESMSRAVAVKVFPRQALNSSRQSDRFLREAQTAGRLHHTNIVPIFGVGEEDGLHFYSMQKIEGVPLDQLISETHHSDAQSDANSANGADSESKPVSQSGFHSNDQVGLVRQPIPLKEAVFLKSGPGRARQPLTEIEVADLGVQVADALAYAHSQGVLHRDIKPANLILDRSGIVWITDFGLATVVTGQSDDGVSEIVGTLRFMAPEQLEGRADERSDLYALGLTLYELLTHEPAFPKLSRREMIRRIAAHDVVALDQNHPEISADLAAIVMKAIAADPARRYSNATEMADDLRRFLHGLPVQARRISQTAKLVRWARRNPVIACLSSLLLILAGISFSVIGVKWHESKVANERAENNLSLALESMNQMLERFTGTWMAGPVILDVGDDSMPVVMMDDQIPVTTASAAVQEDALRFYAEFAKQNPTNPRLQRDTARVHRRMADIYARLGQYEQAEPAYKRSLKLLNASSLSDDRNAIVERAATKNKLGLTLHALSRFSDAALQYRQANVLLTETVHRNEPQFLFERAIAHSHLGQALALLTDRRAARENNEAAINILRTLVESHPGVADYRLSYARACRVQYSQAGRSGGRGSATPRQELRRVAISILEGLVDEFPDVPDYQYELCEMLSVDGFGRGFGGQTEELEQAAKMAESLVEKYPSIPRYRLVYARCYTSLAVRVESADVSKGTEYFEEAIEAMSQLIRRFPKTPAYHIVAAMIFRNYAWHLNKYEDRVACLDAINQAIDYQRRYIQLRPDNSFGEIILSHLTQDLERLQEASRDAEANADLDGNREVTSDRS